VPFVLFQSVPAISVIFAPMFAWLWVRSSTRTVVPAKLALDCSWVWRFRCGPRGRRRKAIKASGHPMWPVVAYMIAEFGGSA
jgi:dipeptide/tripeptide permease